MGKKHVGQTLPHALVREQDLPSSFNLTADEVHASGQRWAGSAEKRAEMLDIEAEEEDFGDGPLMLKDIQARAAVSQQRRRGRVAAKQTSANSQDASSNGGGHSARYHPLSVLWAGASAPAESANGSFGKVVDSKRSHELACADGNFEDEHNADGEDGDTWRDESNPPHDQCSMSEASSRKGAN